MDIALMSLSLRRRIRPVYSTIFHAAHSFNVNISEGVLFQLNRVNAYDNDYNYETVVKQYLEVYEKVGEKQKK